MQSRDEYLEWERVKEFEEEGLVVTVLMLRTERPKYNLEVGFRTQNQKKVIRRLPLTIAGQGRLTIKRLDSTTLARLLHAAEDFALAELQKLEDGRVEQAVRQAPQGGHKGPTGTRTPLGIKSLGKLDKAKRDAHGSDDGKTD